MTKRIVLCADDYGQASPISQGILELIAKKRLSATSCMVNMPPWPIHAQALTPYQDKVDIGLHFNLTEGKALSREYINAYGEQFFSLATLLRKTYLRQLDSDIIAAECHAQIERFQEYLGFLPHFIDGHQHIHQFPIIRDALLRVYQQKLSQPPAYIRLVNEGVELSDYIFAPKKMIIYLSGMKSLKNLLETHRIPHNTSFSGIYNFKRAKRYKDFFPHFLQKVTQGGMIMCHPGLPSNDKADSIAEARYEEYQYLAGDQFLIDCEKEGVIISCFNH